MDEAERNMMGKNSRNDGFWKIPLREDRIYFIDSPASDNFLVLRFALKNAAILAMDAEWKPVVGGSGTASHPRVALLQIACRLRGNLQVGAKEKGGHLTRFLVDGSTEERLRSTSATADLSLKSGLGGRNLFGGNCTNGILHDNKWKDECSRGENFAAQMERREPVATIQRPKKLLNDEQETDKELSIWPKDGFANPIDPSASGNETKYSDEVVFLLDMLALHPLDFNGALKAAFVDPTIVKLGFGFKQDLMHLHRTFSGPEAHGCFDKVEPYLDIGRMYRYLYNDETSFMHRGRRIAGMGCNLSSVTETVLGLPLRKHMQCSNWEQRPLTVSQFDYAAADAYCLVAIFDTLQVKASEMWFPSSPADGDEDVVGSISRSGVIGLQCLLSSEFSVNNDVSTDSRICHSTRGTASVMVNFAMRDDDCTHVENNPTRSKVSKVSAPTRRAASKDALVRRFGEKLLLSETQLTMKKRVRKKSRSRVARESRNGHHISKGEEDLPYGGPPPWDDSVGGDGIPKFLCDAMVEGLARQLRCVGIDAASLNSKKCEPQEMVDLAEKEGRIILTRDAQLLRRRIIPADLAHRVKGQGKWDQLAEVIETFKLSIKEDQLLSRCTKCNGHFSPRPLSAEEAVAQRHWSQVIPECALQNVDEFWQCSSCKHLYWQGTMFTRAYEQFMTICQIDRSHQRR